MTQRKLKVGSVASDDRRICREDAKGEEGVAGEERPSPCYGEGKNKEDLTIGTNTLSSAFKTATAALLQGKRRMLVKRRGTKSGRKGYVLRGPQRQKRRLTKDPRSISKGVINTKGYSAIKKEKK